VFIILGTGRDGVAWAVAPMAMMRDRPLTFVKVCLRPFVSHLRQFLLCLRSSVTRYPNVAGLACRPLSAASVRASLPALLKPSLFTRWRCHTRSSSCVTFLLCCRCRLRRCSLSSQLRSFSPPFSLIAWTLPSGESAWRLMGFHIT
jgi:hypothetical protein